MRQREHREEGKEGEGRRHYFRHLSWVQGPSFPLMLHKPTKVYRERKKAEKEQIE